MIFSIGLSIEDLKDVLTETESASSQWFNLGLVLGVACYELDDIEQNSHDNQERLRKMVMSCIQSNNLSWAGLCSGLEHPTVRRRDVASSIREKYLVTGQNTSLH